MPKTEGVTITYAKWKYPEEGSWLWIFTDAADKAANLAREAKDPKKRKLLWGIVAAITSALVIGAFSWKA